MGDLGRQIAKAQQDNPGVRIDCYVLFDSHTDAMQLYEAARLAGIGARVSTTPRQARSCCGVALLVPSGEAKDVEELARHRSLAYDRIVALPCQIDPKRDAYC